MRILRWRVGPSRFVVKPVNRTSPYALAGRLSRAVAEISAFLAIGSSRRSLDEFLLRCQKPASA